MVRLLNAGMYEEESVESVGSPRELGGDFAILNADDGVWSGGNLQRMLSEDTNLATRQYVILQDKMG